MKAIQITETGGPEVLCLRELPIPEPGPGTALIRVHASGVNFIDVYYREGRYKAELPLVLGREGAGTIERVGEAVAEPAAQGCAVMASFSPGDSVAWCEAAGSYAEYAVVPLDKLVAVAPGLDLKLAAASMLQGMTAHYLTHSTVALKRGDTVLVHAAAGGVGLLLTQMAAQLGARVIATVSTEEKAALAREAGASEVILYSGSDFEAETMRLTDGQGVDVVYDSVGKTTFEKSLNCLRARGLLALYGASSGAVPPFDPIQLSVKGSLFLTRPALGSYIKTREELTERATEVLDWVAQGKLKVRIGHTYALAEAGQAHRDLESRKTTGKILLLDQTGRAHVGLG
ncbi:MAG TPA: quinone oxidoreductase [Acidisarcina sp.]